MDACKCGAPLRAVGAQTLCALVPQRTLNGLSSLDGFGFCDSPTCSVVYFRGVDSASIQADELDVLVFEKADEPTRLVCYCFGFTVADVTGPGRDRPDAPDRTILANCRRGLANCAVKNPSGHCCMRNVRGLLRQDPTCCSATDGSAHAR